MTMVINRDQRRVEELMVTSILRKAKYGDNLKMAKAAEKVLCDTQMFDMYVDIRIERREETQRIKEGRLTYWERFVRFIGRKA